MNNYKFSEYTTNYISGVMSLRKPQRKSLEILDDLVGDIDLNKSLDKEALKNKAHHNYPIFTDYDRAFPSFTFALATGVGKTRLMGAFVTYLYARKNIKNFLVVAPSLTIYNKLINDFANSSSSKYVFNGVGCFEFGPYVISGDEYRKVNFGNFSDVKIFVYNAQKFNSNDENRRFNSLNEVLGKSFFDYLSELDDLVVLMDEAHHYRNNSTSEALDKIKPVLGLELTATPQVISGKKVIPFKNVVIDYPLALSIKDGYTRTPYALTRNNIEQYKWGDEQLDKIMINDGLHWHEHMKKVLKDYADRTGNHYVKPFMLVVCQNIDHANSVLSFIKSNECLGGKYKSQVIEIDSGKGAVEKDENVQLLLNVERADNPVEIIVHVNMLKEGWDVNNLYTIVPLRSAYSRTLVEQTIGRGLRLPYGKRTGEKEIDSVTMTAHANFTNVINDAKRGDSIFKKEHIIYVEDIDKPKEAYSQTKLDLEFGNDNHIETTINKVLEERPDVERNDVVENIVRKITSHVEEVVKANKGNGLIENRKEIEGKVSNRIITDTDIAEKAQEGQLDSDFITRIFTTSIDQYVKVVENNTIAIPKLVEKFDGDVTYFFDDFDLDLSQFTFVPVSTDLIRANLIDPRDRYFESTYEIDFSKINPARVIVTILRDKAEIDYEECGELVIKLINQYFDSLKERYTDNQIRNIVDSNKYRISDEIYKQMMRHYKTKVSGLVEVVSSISYDIKRPLFNSEQIMNAFDLYDDVPTGMDIKSIVFRGGKKWLTEFYKFDSGSEKDFAVSLENDRKVIHWLRPAKDQFDLQYKFEGIVHEYEPDFVVETEDTCYLVEVKRRSEMNDPQVLAKKQRGLDYCKKATQWCIANHHKLWKYLFIPHDQITETTSFESYLINFLVKE